MKKLIITITCFLISLLFSTEITAQKFPKLDVSPMDVAAFPSSYRISEKLVKIVYSRPQLKGRKLTKLAPKGKIWRTGANEAAEITFYKDVLFAGKEVKAGTYTFFTIPNTEEWTIILSNQKNVWGAYFYNEDDDVVRVQAKATEKNKTVTAFSIAFEEGKKDNTVLMYLGWADVVVTVPISSKTE